MFEARVFLLAYKNAIKNSVYNEDTMANPKVLK